MRFCMLIVMSNVSFCGFLLRPDLLKQVKNVKTAGHQNQGWGLILTPHEISAKILFSPLLMLDRHF